MKLRPLGTLLTGLLPGLDSAAFLVPSRLSCPRMASHQQAITKMSHRHETCLQVNLMEVIPQLRLPLPRQADKTKQNTMSPSNVPEAYVFLEVGEPESFGPASLSHCGWWVERRRQKTLPLLPFVFL